VYKAHYRRFLDLHPGELHFTAHSHHYWPDVTREAQIESWDDAARYVDGKWDYLYQAVIPETRRLIARTIGSKTPEQIAFAPNTHEFVCRLLSCFEPAQPLAILTTDSEFHSFRRQLCRLAEYPWIKVRWVAAEPADGFNERFLTALSEQPYGFIFLSQVFFNSGLAVQDLARFMETIRQRAPDNALIVLDGYHGFMALPTDIEPFADRVFYLAGGYKYAQAGEGVCFLHVPTGCQLRPANTGWFAEYAQLAAPKMGQVVYPDGAQRFAGATFDPGGIYRLRAVLRLVEALGLRTPDIHRWVETLQQRFISRLEGLHHPAFTENTLIYRKGQAHGHFLTFELASMETAQSWADALERRRVFVDCRGNRLRFGFGLYHDLDDIDELCRRLRGSAG
jgi:selenocysteine lyase/cysteine desulfurase